MSRLPIALSDATGKASACIYLLGCCLVELMVKMRRTTNLTIAVSGIPSGNDLCYPAYSSGANPCCVDCSDTLGWQLEKPETVFLEGWEKTFLVLVFLNFVSLPSFGDRPFPNPIVYICLLNMLCYLF